MERAALCVVSPFFEVELGLRMRRGEKRVQVRWSGQGELRERECPVRVFVLGELGVWEGTDERVQGGLEVDDQTIGEVNLGEWNLNADNKGLDCEWVSG